MTGFVIVNPRKRIIEGVQCDSVFEAQRHAGLAKVDHGVIAKGLGYVVDEFGLFVPTAEQYYFGLFGKLIAGTAVFYAFDQMGEALSLRTSEFPDVRMYLGVNDVEAAISRGEIERPFMAVGGAVLWEWPQPAPSGFTR